MEDKNITVTEHGYQESEDMGTEITVGELLEKLRREEK